MYLQERQLQNFEVAPAVVAGLITLAGSVITAGTQIFLTLKQEEMQRQQLLAQKELAEKQKEMQVLQQKYEQEKTNVILQELKNLAPFLIPVSLGTIALILFMVKKK
jgi:multidrug efflux pump subunit AcrA (membrane-fusion protein)